MSRAEREKGKRGEREVARLLLLHGHRARRDGRLDADLEHDLDGVHIEVKRTERPRLAEWCAIAARDATIYSRSTWAIAWRCNRQDWVAVIPFAEYARLK